ncbi:unnamed protein product [Adineta steineri]|uniref:HTH La-type RNA-binding domain-containing protein n=1 Tax=Adineta steineri TaxID=433720 RepID=A0A814XTP2_9BILA|nr:unnamed protein product [Adineta steineri]
MTQATVNVGSSVVKNLNPNAQHFSASDYNTGTVLAGPTVPSDDLYGEYIDNGTGSYLRQHQSHMYPVDPSSIDTLQQQQQQTESNFAVHEHAAMLDTIDHQQTPLLNPNHLHHPQPHIHQTMPDEEQAQHSQLTPEQLRQHLRKQLEYYFSRENMVNDIYLKSQMDADDYVPITIIANFKLVKRFTRDLQLIVDVLKELPSVEVDAEDKKVRSADEKKYRPTGKRCIIILRDVPLDATENEVTELFLNEHCPVPALACERALESGTSDCWYITFNSEDDAQNAFLYLTRENVSIRGHKVLARMKARLWQKPSSVPSTNPSTPVSPPVSTNNSGATSPPPPPQQQQQQQQPIQTYQNSAFVPQQQQQQQVQPPPPPQYSSHPQQQQFNQQQMPPPSQQQHAPVYMQPTTSTHPNQTSILGNIQQQTNNYRHPMHPSVAPPPPQHVAAQFSTANQTQHPSSLEHAQALQHLRMSYQNYGPNTPFDRTTWTTAHPQTVQTTQPTLSFATSAQQANMTSYPTSIHQQPQFIAANHPVFQAGNLWYMSSPYPTTEQYPTMAYNGASKQKTRMPREYPITSKSRNSTKPSSARNSRHEGLQMNNEHSNELLDYCQHSTPHSEGSSSPVPRAEAVINRTNEPIAQAVSNTSLQHVQTYPPNTIDTSINDNIDHYHHHQSTNDVLYNNANSHVQQQGSSDTNLSQEQTNESQNLGKFPVQSSYPTSTSIENSKLNYQPLEQRKPPSINRDQQQQQQHPSNNDNQQQQSNKKLNPQQTSIRPLMSGDNRSNQNSNRPSSSSQQGRPQQQQQQQQTRMNSNSSTPLTVTIPKVPSATYYNQTSSSSPQSPNSNQKAQQQQQQQQSIDNNGPRTYADMLKVKTIPQQQQTDSTKSPTNETNDLSSPRGQSPINNNPKTDSVSVNPETNGPLSSSSASDLSPSNQTEPPAPTSQSSTINESNPVRRNSSASDHPQQQHSSSPSHQQYNNSRGRGGGGGRGGGNYRYSNERRSGSSNSLNRGGGGGGGGRGGGRRSVNNNAGPNGPPAYQSRGSGNRGNGRFFDRSRGGGGNYHNSNQTVHRFTGSAGNVEPQVHYAE